MPDSSQPTAATILDQLIREREPRLRAMARTAAGSDAEEVFQNACVGFLVSFDPVAAYGDLDGAQQYLQAAIFNAGRKLRRSQTRRDHALPTIEPSSESDPLDAIAGSVDPEDVLLRGAEQAEAIEQLRAIPSRWREVLLAREMGYGPTEIQAGLGLSARQYRKRIDKARSRLAKHHGGD